ncbi:MAG TPA: restriction endonuclease [Firmicutes bacterium]|jgi:type II restriction enzyme|nr:restriction endonuclease [Bacillota bacterium]HBG44976.1 restriction endonuclease [Bacillota bacterium]HCF90189.1 restriction endonuclease [Bacillota bacterium]HCX70805.1 restriction endonuclease [Bacillota bacterium]
MASTAIKTIDQASPTIYAYITPNDVSKKGWVKIGYTDRDAETRIKEQTHTSDTKYELLWSHDARYDGGEYFTDDDFHWYLVQSGIERGKFENTGRLSEWFYFGEGNEKQAEELFRKFIFRDYGQIQDPAAGTQYQLREEQADAVKRTLAYLKSGKEPADFLWNAKPRFGKTLATYDFIRKGGFKNVLIVTNRPAIANSWYDDFMKFIKWQEPHMFFVSDSDSLKNTRVLSRQAYCDIIINSNDEQEFKQIAFVSLQDLKGSIAFGGIYDKLKWVADLRWDLLVVDEAHEGVDTSKTDWAFSRIIRKFTLYMSGTPFKAIANSKFSAEQIFNWSYADEQEAKRSWDFNKGSNPYEPLPQLNMFTFQLSAMIEEKLLEGQTIGETTYDFAFDLNEFFAVEEGKTTFKHEKDVKKWLERLTKNEKYPFSTPALRKELKHTFWLLDRVASAKALAKLLENDAAFMHHKITIAAGDGKDLNEEAEDFVSNEKSYDKVRKVIAENEYTITISVGQLTTGVTIPEWTAVMMLSNIASPALYMQAAFRCQNPYHYEKNGKYYKKENAYIFDFAPDRTLVMFDDFANKLLGQGSVSDKDRPENIKRLLNFFPVIGEDEHGTMVPLDATQVLTIPRTILATEVVKRGFMSNLLFANISGIFALPKEIVDSILSELPVEKQGKKDTSATTIDLSGIKMDEDGNVVVPTETIISKKNELFGDKVYDVSAMTTAVETAVGGISSEAHVPLDVTAKIVDVAMDLAKPIIVDTVKTGFDLTNTQADKIEKQVKEIITEKVKAVENDNYRKQFEVKQKAAEEIKMVEESLAEDEIETAIKEIEAKQRKEFERLRVEFTKNLNETIKETIEEQKTVQVEEQAQIKAKKNKDSKEEEVRGHLRGFARTIPSFLMAYGERGTRLCNFDNYTPEEVFLEVTGITEEQFRFLRDGGTYIDDMTGEEKHFSGGLFNEIVFDEAIQEFLNIRERLADYFDESHQEDIFNYIPPQETNQIFTPKQVVKMMVQKLEDEDPHIFEDPDKTFIDLFMKSGLYITELVKRLFNNPVMKEKIPDNDARLKHILEKQLYGLAPSDIIYHIATNYIFSFDAENRISRKHFKSVDTRPAVKEGKLDELLVATFDDLK